MQRQLLSLHQLRMVLSLSIVGKLGNTSNADEFLCLHGRIQGILEVERALQTAGIDTTGKRSRSLKAHQVAWSILVVVRLSQGQLKLPKGDKRYSVNETRSIMPMCPHANSVREALLSSRADSLGELLSMVWGWRSIVDV